MASLNRKMRGKRRLCDGILETRKQDGARRVRIQRRIAQKRASAQRRHEVLVEKADQDVQGHLDEYIEQKPKFKSDMSRQKRRLLKAKNLKST